MTTPLSAVITARLEKAAIDNGFDQELPRVGEWLVFASTQCPLSIWLTMPSNGGFVAAFSKQNVVRALSDVGTAHNDGLPNGAVGARRVADIPALHHLVRRAFQLAKSLPDELLHTFVRTTSALPRATEAERLVVQRVGQDIFRAGLIDYWEGKCAITGLTVTEVLRASHIKPWADCETDRERLDAFNGFLLAPHLDATFDRGFITIMDDGGVRVSTVVGINDRKLLGLAERLRITNLTDEHRVYLAWHRSKVFK